MFTFRPPDVRRYFPVALALATAYYLTATLGFRLAFVAEQVTTVWMPTGLAQAALLLWGRSLWPAVWIGAFAANVGFETPLWTAALIATGNTLEAVVAAWVLSQLLDFDPSFRRTRDGLAFIVVASGLSTTISAAIGVAGLTLAGAQPWGRMLELWWAWWVGDALGSLVVGPTLLTLARPPFPRSRRYWAEAAVMIGSTALVTHFVFSQVLGANSGHHPLEYAIVPFVITAAVRLGLPATGLLVLVASAVKIWNTILGIGPFATQEINASLILLQVFTSVLAGTGVLLGAAIAERKTGERRRAAAHAVGEVLAEAPTLQDAAPGILRSVCENLRWSLGAIWLVDQDGKHIECLTVWKEPVPRFDEFARVTQAFRFQAGVGLPGRVWSGGRAVWIENVLEDANFPRAGYARGAGLHGAFGFPIRLGPEVLGVVEFFNRGIAAPDQDLLRTMSTVGNQIGQFVARKRVEAAVLEGQRRTLAIVNSALDAIIGMDHQGRITEFNPAAERTFGYTQEQALGRDMADLLIPERLRERHRQGLRRYVTTGRAATVERRIETTARHADGHEFPIEVSVTRIVEAAPPIFTGFVRDLTAHARAEQEREQLLHRELTARRDAEAANRAKDEFLATLSHELRTPLNAIVGWTRMLLDESLDERSRKHALEVIDRNAQLQVRLVEDILDVSRIITGGLRLERKPVDLGTVIGAALDGIRPAADAKRIRIQCRIAAQARLTEGDPQRLQQIVWNLLANAVKFTPQGGNVDVELLDTADHGVRIVVRDNGVGIEPVFLPHVFERFRQADGSASRQHGGLGLGLAIVRHFAELHGGTVKAESDGPGRGSTFIIDLPRLAVGSAADPAGLRESPFAKGPSAPTLLTGCRALVVDDEEDARVLLAAILERAGAIVQSAATVHDALALLDSSSFDVLLSDIGMAGADGYALVEEVRRRETLTGGRLPALAVTAYAGANSRDRAFAAGFDGHLAKPIVPSDVINSVVAVYQAAGRPS